jgi:NADPH-dependent 2,4-dienoyl-CoA reductase/sulfur reductase-like enzyme
MKAIYDVAVIGAGPAGLVAATVAARHALSAVLFDEQSAPGGQIYRAITSSPATRRAIVGDDYARGALLVDAFRQSGATAVHDATVWAVRRRDDGLHEVGISHGAPGARSVRFVSARALILATGAIERAFPIPGWTLPGVMTAGAAQALLKSSGVVADCRVVLAGTGPLLWLVAAQYLKAGVKLTALLDTTPRGRHWNALPNAWEFAGSSYFRRGAALLRFVRRRVRVIRNVTTLAASGPGRLESVQFDAAGGPDALGADLLLLHQGVVPDINLGSAIGCTHRWNDAQACFEPVTDAWGGTSIPGVFAAGDAAGIAGAEAAEARAHLAALAVANGLGRIDAKARDLAAEAPYAALRRATRGRAFLDALYRPADAHRRPQGDTIVCRCEEVTAEQVIDAVKAGAPGPNQVKAFLRCGMGPCQGRYCGLTVTELVAQERRIPPSEAGYFRLRWPAKPITLKELASLGGSADAERAVVRGTRWPIVK